MNVRIIQGDITKIACDAIVNAANPALLGGGGVDGAIHRAAGPSLLTECRALPEKSPDVRCPIGGAVITGGYRLPAAWVIHTVGPVFKKAGPLRPGEGASKGGPGPEEMLVQTFWACMCLAQQKGLKSVAFPAISCGVYGCPIEKGAECAWSALQAIPHSWDVAEVTFVLASDVDRDIWREVFARLDAITK